LEIVITNPSSSVHHSNVTSMAHPTTNNNNWGIVKQEIFDKMENKKLEPAHGGFVCAQPKCG
jgi:hypothetical protein